MSTANRVAPPSSAVPSTDASPTAGLAPKAAGAPTGNAALAARDLAHVWHPCTQMRDHEQLPPLPVRRATGCWLEDYEGRRYLDAISSWWVNLFGHCHPAISAAVAAQLQQCEHVLLAGVTHEPAVAVAEELVRIAPPGLTRCFFRTTARRQWKSL